MSRRWVYKPKHPKANERGFVAFEDLGGWSEKAADAPILVGRFYENTKLTDGTVLNTRSQYKAYMREKGITNASDFGPSYYENVRKEQARAEEKDRRETVARATWEAFDGRK